MPAATFGSCFVGCITVVIVFARMTCHRDAENRIVSSHEAYCHGRHLPRNVPQIVPKSRILRLQQIFYSYQKGIFLRILHDAGTGAGNESSIVLSNIGVTFRHCILCIYYPIFRIPASNPHGFQLLLLCVALYDSVIPVDVLQETIVICPDLVIPR